MPAKPTQPQVGSQSQYDADPVEFSFNDHRLVVMTQETMDKIVMPISRAIAACANQAMADSIERSTKEKSRSFVEHIAAWCKQRAPVRAALLDPREAGRFLLMLVVENESPDAELGDDVADLALELFKRFPEFPISAMTMPVTRPGGIGAFVDPQHAVLLYAKHPGTHANG